MVIGCTGYWSLDTHCTGCVPHSVTTTDPRICYATVLDSEKCNNNAAQSFFVLTADVHSAVLLTVLPIQLFYG